MEFSDIIKLINQKQFDALDVNDPNTKAILLLLINHGWVSEDNNKLIKIKRPELVYGHLDVKPTFGFLVGETDYYIKEPTNYFNNEEVIAFIDPNKSNASEAIIIDRIEENFPTLVFRINDKHEIICCEPNYASYHFELLQKMLLPTNSIFKAEVKDVTNKAIFVSFIDEISLNPDLDEAINLILATNNISWHFDDDVLCEANRLENKDYQNLARVDLRDKGFVTIDGASSKDLDDAVYLEKVGNDYHLYVSIADVDNFVHQDTVLDEEAYHRGNSVYFLDYVIPMLPPVLSNGLCSLNPHVDRYTMTCEMLIDQHGTIKEYKVYPSIIKSHHRLTYSQVNDYIMRNISDDAISDCLTMLSLMDDLREILFNKRSQMGAFNFEEPEVKFLVDQDHNIVDIMPIVRENGEKLIEEFMIAANYCVANIINQMDLPFLYRVHDQPNQDDFDQLIKNLNNLGFNLRLNQDKRFLYRQIKEQITDPSALAIVEKLLVRSLPKAKYQVVNIGHFGLSLEDYTHFTSPIRRYSDLVVHRLLKKYLINCDYNVSGEMINQLNTTCAHINQTEINAQRAERSIIDLKKVDYMQRFIHQRFIGRVSNIYDNKMVIELPNSVRGNVFLSDYYDFKEVEHYCVKFRDREFRLLDEVEVEVSKVDRQKQRISFNLVGYKRRFANYYGRRKHYGKNKYKKEEKTKFKKQNHYQRKNK